MPPLPAARQPAAQHSTTRTDRPATREIGIGALRLYLAAASVLVVVKIVQLALGH